MCDRDKQTQVLGERRGEIAMSGGDRSSQKHTIFTTHRQSHVSTIITGRVLRHACVNFPQREEHIFPEKRVCPVVPTVLIFAYQLILIMTHETNIPDTRINMYKSNCVTSNTEEKKRCYT